MSDEQNPYQKLGVSEDASFEAIQEAKNRLTQQHSNDTKLKESIETAYDAIIMDRLKQRQQGKIKVPERIRFPEKVTPAPPKFTPPTLNNSPGWLQQLWDTPSQSDILWSAAVFAILGGLTLFSDSSNQSMLSLTIALGFGACIYFLNRKEQKFGRSVLLSLVGLLVGVGLGTLLASFLTQQLLGIGLSAEVLTTLLSLLFFWLISSFLR
ncbi:MAG: CPP1-like family protein [Oscillatoria sp. PMC 1051.18]|nr:CPP1-like family protein [Oscillatoria sp. PMC 1050.18]MEC5030560.1 CPP1-like family protein [Oscillatoria sp. PMC 1051.18]